MSLLSINLFSSVSHIYRAVQTVYRFVRGFGLLINLFSVYYKFHRGLLLNKHIIPPNKANFLDFLPGKGAPVWALIISRINQNFLHLFSVLGAYSSHTYNQILYHLACQSWYFSTSLKNFTYMVARTCLVLLLSMLL